MTEQPTEQPTDYNQSLIVQTAIEFGLVKPGWTLEDYLLFAAREGRYATVCVWGEQGSYKSNRLLQQGYWIYKDWDMVLDNLVFKPLELKAKLKALPMGQRYPWIGWDDVGVHYTSSTFRINIDEYSAIDAVWASLRVKCSVVTLTIPNISRLARNLKDNVSHECYLGPNAMEQVQRIVRLQSFKQMEAETFKVLIERGPFEPYKVPRDVFSEYWERRLVLTEEALDLMDEVTGPESTKGYTAVWDLQDQCSLSANSIQQMGSRGVLPTIKIGSVLYVPDDFVPKLVGKYPPKGV
jgi:hypothetical protein